MMMDRAQGTMPFTQAIAAMNALKSGREAAHRRIDALRAAPLDVCR